MSTTFSTPRPRNFQGRGGNRPSKPKPEPVILFQKYFKSVGPRTYAAQVKRVANGNHMLVLTEGKRDEVTGELRKSRLFVYSEDFVEMFKLLHDSAEFIRANPLSDKVKADRAKFWADGGGTKRKAGTSRGTARSTAPTTA